MTVVGTGIKLAVHVTPEARAAIENADELLYLVPDAVSMKWLEGLNLRARSLDRFYELGRARSETYAAMVEEILASVRRGLRVCAAFYGHPGIFVDPSHEAIRRARLEGFSAKMLPGISAEDCLIADLGIDPGDTGCQSYEATSFLIHRQQVETSALLVLWQLGVVGTLASLPAPEGSGLAVLTDYLSEFYPGDHETIVYEASPYVVAAPIVRRVSLNRLAETEVPALATLIVPPAEPPLLDVTMLDRLGLPRP